ncbi:hypothetical protein D3C78_1249320 [compost metagenome]
MSYMEKVLEQCERGEPHFGAITRRVELSTNLAANCLPEDLEAYRPEAYEDFLAERRRQMALKIKGYYWGL